MGENDDCAIFNFDAIHTTQFFVVGVFVVSLSQLKLVI